MKRLYLKALAAVILGCIQSISALGCAWLLKTIVDIVTGVNIAFSLKQFYILAFVYYGFYMLFYYVGKKIYVRTVCDFRVYLREKLLNGLLWVKESAYAKRTLGTVLSMFQYQVDLMEEACFDSLSALIKDTAAILVSLGAVFLMQWQIAAGSILAAQPVVFLGLVLVFLVCVFASKIVSLSSIVVAALYPVFTYFWSMYAGNDVVLTTSCAAVMGAMVIWMHRANIKRLLAGTEYKFGQKKD